MGKTNKKLVKSSQVNGIVPKVANQQEGKRPKKRPKTPNNYFPTSSEGLEVSHNLLNITDQKGLKGQNSLNQTTGTSTNDELNNIPRKKKRRKPKKVEFNNDTSIFLYERDVHDKTAEATNTSDDEVAFYSSEHILNQSGSNSFENHVKNQVTSQFESEISDEEHPEEQACSSAESDIDFDFYKDNTYEVTQENENEFYITLYKDAIIYMHGLVALLVLQGSVEVLGYELKPSDKTVNIYSPAGSALLSISNCTKRKTGEIATVLCKRLSSRFSRSLSQYAPKNIFPPLQENGTQCIVGPSARFEKFAFIETSADWKIFAGELTTKSRVIITGTKGAGKSTLLRYLINKLLSKDRKNSCGVLVVDLDPGQPEFTLPGCISIVLVKSPIFGPNYTHQQKPEKCIHVSSVDIKYNMDEYISCCKYLLSLVAEYPNLPILINYIGFSKGLGQHLISTIISFANPTNVVQINDPNGKYNFRKDLTIENVKEDSKWIPNSTEDVDLSFELVKFETVHNYNKLFHLRFTPREFRDIGVVSYLSTILRGDPLCLTDPAVKIYRAPLDQLKIQDSWGNSHPAIINANLVSLCQKVTFENSDIFVCLGWAVVRCVSIPRNVVYLLTPVKLDVLEQFKYLVLSGSVRLPLAMYITTAKDISGQIPYIEDGQQTDLEKISKRQRYNHEKANQ